MLNSDNNTPLLGIALILAILTLSGCAGSEPRPLLTDSLVPTDTAVTVAEPARFCAGGTRPVCLNRLGKKVRCSCMTRNEFERTFISDY